MASLFLQPLVSRAGRQMDLQDIHYFVRVAHRGQFDFAVQDVKFILSFIHVPACREAAFHALKAFYKRKQESIKKHQAKRTRPKAPSSAEYFKHGLKIINKHLVRLIESNGQEWAPFLIDVIPPPPLSNTCAPFSFVPSLWRSG